MKRHSSIRTFAVLLLVFVMTFSVPLPARAGVSALSPVEPVSGRTLKVLFIGNSFSVDTTRYIRDIVGQTGYKISIGDAWIGGARLGDHAANAKSNAKKYTYLENTKGSWVTRRYNGSMTWRLSWILSRKKWDVIILQSYSTDIGKPSSFYPDGDSSKTSHLEYLAKWCKKKCPGAAIGYNMTWACPSGSNADGYAYYGGQMKMMKAAWKTTKTLLEEAEEEEEPAPPESEELFEDLEDSGGGVVKTRPDEGTGVEFVIPTGTAIQNARSSYFGDSLNRDNKHLTYGLGRFIASMTAAASLGYPIEKVSEMKLSDPASTLHLPVIQASAGDAVAEPFALTQEAEEVPILGNVEISVTSQKRRITVKWDKVDGAMSYRVRYKLPGMKSYKAVNVGAGTTSFTFNGKKGTNRVRVYARGDDRIKRSETAYEKIKLP